MKIIDVIEWIEIAEDDLASAEILFEHVRRPLEIICYHCTQSIEKYLKGFLVYNDIVPLKTHDLPTLLDMCKNIDDRFKVIKTECDIMNRYGSNMRYPNKIEVLNEDAKYCIKSVKKVQKAKPIQDMIEFIQNYKKTLDSEK